MQYPLISEYLAAIREAKDNLDTLSHLVPVLDKYGEPYRSSGAFAVVFKMKDEQTGKCYALKCFTEEQEGRAEAYHKIAEELEFVDSPYITSVKYLEKEMFVDSNCEDEEFPVLLMDWIEGETMETYIAANYTDTHAMAMLCYRFCKMAAWLRSQSFAHGDIKPDNIMVRPDGTLTLVDYDGMFVPTMKGQKSPTIGTKDFSHPLRTIDGFDETIDDFALASIALSLKAISLDPSLLQTYGASDRLLFSAADYLDLSKSKTFTALQGLLADEEAKTLLSMFLLASAKKNLSMCSFRLFGVQKPKDEDVQKPKVKEVQKPKNEEVWSTEVINDDLRNAVEDEFGVKYSKDWKRLLKAPLGLEGEYSIRKGVKVIGNSAFWLCSSLTNINIPNSVTNIGNEAFSGCKSLTKITIPSSVVNMNGNPFLGWDGDLYNESEGFIYEQQVLFNKDKTTLIAYRSKDTNYSISNSVTNIGKYAFFDCKSLTSINIPNSVTNIGDRAFKGCISLTKINIPNSVTNIGDGAFYACKSLININIPNSVTNIGFGTFSRCESLTNINIPNSVTNIGEMAFSGCKSLININIPNSVTNIGKMAFSGCKSLININIPNSVTNIGDRALGLCESLTSINIPNSVTNIGDSAFAGCKSLTSINIPDGVTNIGDGAFWPCESLTSINIPNSVTNIGDSAFAGCKSLTSINIPDGVTNIGDGAFSGCKSLTKITIPSSVVNMNGNPFLGWNGDLHNESKAFVYERQVLFNIDKTTLIAYRSKKTSYNIPNGVTNIGDKAFYGCESLTSIKIPKSVSNIGSYAFSGCKSLTSINIPDSVTNIGNRVFSDCESLTNIKIPDSVTNIGNNIFGGCEKDSSKIKIVIPQVAVKLW